MTPTDKARRSDALYFDNINRRSLCDLVSSLESDNADLRSLAHRLYQCSLLSSCGLCKNLGKKCDFPRDMRALGIDVAIEFNEEVK